MSKKLNKQVELQLIGEEMEVDKNVIEQISDPLMYLVRNAVDKGIECPEERLTKGKEEKGKSEKSFGSKKCRWGCINEYKG